jgi:D-lyxose ketol-isomerase
MITRAEYKVTQKKAKEMLDNAGIVITLNEASQIEVADLRLGDLNQIGLQLVVYVNTDRVCSKEIILFPHRICPEHRHLPIGSDPSKEETFRCRWGMVYFYVPGKLTLTPKGIPPTKQKRNSTVRHEVILQPGSQYTLRPNTPHWFQGGGEGAIVSELSTRSKDEADIFTDPNIKRQTVVAGQH